MKKTNIILVILLSCFSGNSYAEDKGPDVLNNFTNSIHVAVQESVDFIKKHAWIIALTPITIYHHKDITDFIIYRPYISSFAFYLSLNYVCDSIVNYQKQQSLLRIIALIKKITLYLVMCHGVKNYIQDKKLSTEYFLDEESFFNTVTVNLPYSFNEITFIILKSYQELKLSVQYVNMKLIIESEEFVFLCHASSITMQTLFYLTQNDADLYKMMYQFEENPENNYKKFVEFLTVEITQTFFDLEKLLLDSNIQSRIAS